MSVYSNLHKFNKKYIADKVDEIGEIAEIVQNQMDKGDGNKFKTPEFVHDLLSEANLPSHFSKSRHLEEICSSIAEQPQWRMKERMKTVSVALVLCLNIGVDPPDVIKTSPCARMECWIDPLATGHQKSLEQIGQNLKMQYERWQPRARYKQVLDPTVDEIKKLCATLRRNAKEERVLFHYNGHGVPKPTTNGEIWVFNRSYTQYIPLSLYDLHSWMGTPSIYVFDCNCAGLIMKYFDQHLGSSTTDSSKLDVSDKAAVRLAACGIDQMLPMSPNLPADLFTSCLTTPIKMALKWFVQQNSHKFNPDISEELIEKIPGHLTDRKSLLGELNWIFTAITDTIAWNCLPSELFQHLFRQDLLLASLFRNFLLAERIMKAYNCEPISAPMLPPMHMHPMWQAWDCTLDMCLSKLPSILANNDSEATTSENIAFFSEQSQAFTMWLKFASINKNPPDQLPIVLQVLLSQGQRIRALDLLSQFMSVGKKMVLYALRVGIFPYVLKLLQSGVPEIRPFLVSIWTKIIAVDQSVQTDLIRDENHNFFLSFLANSSIHSEHRTMAAFIISKIVNNYPQGQEAVLKSSVIFDCLSALDHADINLRQWLCFCLAKAWDGHTAARWAGTRDLAHEKLAVLLHNDSHPEVRAAAAFALGTFVISSNVIETDLASKINQNIAMILINASKDCSPLVRKEVLVSLSNIILQYENTFINTCKHMAEEEFMKFRRPNNHNSPKIQAINLQTFEPVQSGDVGMRRNASTSCLQPSVSIDVFQLIWRIMKDMKYDPFPQVENLAKVIVKFIESKVESSTFKSSTLPRNFSRNMPSNSTVSAPSSPSNKPIPNMLYAQNESNLEEFFTPKNASSPKPRQTSTNAEGERENRLVSTKYFEWASERFAFPSINQQDLSDPDSDLTIQKLSRVELSEDVVNYCKTFQVPSASNLLLDHNQYRAMKPVSVMNFHPFEPLLAVADNDGFSIYDWEQETRLAHFLNNRPKGKISCVKFINCVDMPMIMIGSGDGCVKFWRNYMLENDRRIDLVTSWVAVPELVESRSHKPNGLLLKWEPQRSQLISCGDFSKSVRIYDVNVERQCYEFSTCSDYAITGIESDDCMRNLIFCSYEDGVIRVFDRRKKSSLCKVASFRDHKNKVLGVRLHNKPSSVFMTADETGLFKVWDVRKNMAINSFKNLDHLLCFDLHRKFDLLIAGSQQPISIQIGKPQNETLKVLQYYPGFMSQKIATPYCLTFHPNFMKFAAGSRSDNLFSVYTIHDKVK